jgi:predicted nuclease with RNAse H fold
MVVQLRHHVATTGVLVEKSQDLDVPPASPTLRRLLQRGASITRLVEHTAKGVVVTETSNDSVTVSLLQAHAAEVTELVTRGMAAMHENMMRRRGPPPPP